VTNDRSHEAIFRFAAPGYTLHYPISQSAIALVFTSQLSSFRFFFLPPPFAIPNFEFRIVGAAVQTAQ
jgi:hypothetical protein